jgi:hypothetical protein
MIREDVIGESNTVNAFSGDGRRRTLHEARMARASTATSLSLYSTRVDPRGKRSLRATHPSAAPHHRRRALRARHLSFNRLTRPQRRTQEASSALNELLDSISVKGGYDGTQVFIKFEMDVSKENVNGLDAIITKPLDLLSDNDLLSRLNLFSGDSANETLFHLVADISFSSSAHIGVTGKICKSPSHVDWYQS